MRADRATPSPRGSADRIELESLVAQHYERLGCHAVQIDTLSGSRILVYEVGPSP